MTHSTQRNRLLTALVTATTALTAAPALGASGGAAPALGASGGAAPAPSISGGAGPAPSASGGAAPAPGASGGGIPVLALERGQGDAPLERLTFQPGAPPSATQPPSLIRIDDTRRYQPIWGVGAAMTNTSSFLIQHGLPPSRSAALISDLFSPVEAGLGFVRVTIGGSDFNVGGRRYSEDDMPLGRSDPGLRHFSLSHDTDTIAVLREALRNNPHLRVLASPWSAPGWMKANDSLDDVAFKGRLKPQYYAAYAQYFVKFVNGYQRAGVPIWGLTVQNEPFGVPASYEGMNLPAADAARFVRYYLRPALRRAKLNPYIFALDASWDGGSYASTVTRLAGGLSGVAWHCYVGNADAVMQLFSSTTQVLSECAPNLIRGFVSALLSNVFNNGARAAALWNVAEDPAGGPVVPPNQSCRGCQGLVTIDPRTGRLTYNQDYFSLRQFGRFLRPGAVRIYATRLGHFDDEVTDRATPGLHTVAFLNPDHSEVLVVANNDSRTRTFAVRWRSMTLTHPIRAKGTVTLLWG
jgi:glucosylceramidase